MGNSGKSKKTKKKAATVIKSSEDDNSNHLYAPGSKTKIDLFSQQGKYVDRSESQKSFINNEGFEEYRNARKIGYKVRGAAMLLALSAKESSYGVPEKYKVAVEQNNFFGDKYPHSKKNRIFSTPEDGIQKGVSFFDDNSAFVDFRSSARQENPDISTLGEDMKNYDPISNGGLGDKYASYLNDQMIPYVVQRMLETIPQKLIEIQDQREPYRKELESLSMSESPLNSKQKKRLEELMNNDKKLNAERDEILHIQNELKTGNEDTGQWYKDKSNPSPGPTTSPSITPPFTSDIAGNPAPSYMGGMGSNRGNDFSSLFNLVDYMNRQSTDSPAMQSSGNNTGNQAPVLKAIGGKHHSQGHSPGHPSSHPSGTHAGGHAALEHPSKVPGTGSLAHPADGKSAANNGGGNGGIAFHIQNMGTHKHRHGSAAKHGNDMYSQVLAVLQGAIGDSKIGIDIC